MTAEELVSNIEEESKDLSSEIIDKVCNRAIRGMNRKMKTFPLVDGYPDNFTFFDILSCETQSKTYDEIVFMGSRTLADFIEDSIDIEFDKLAPIEKAILSYMDFSPDFGSGYEFCDAHKFLYSRFNEMLNEHWSESKKIENYEMTL